MSQDLMRRLSLHFPKFAARITQDDGVIHDVLPPATEADIRAAEQQVGVPFPESYKEFLRFARGFWMFRGCVQFGIQHPFRHEFEPLSSLSALQRDSTRRKGGIWPPPSNGMLCFGEYFLEADGDQVLLDITEPMVNGEYRVMYYAHEGNPPSVRELAPDFRSFVEEVMVHAAFG